MTASLFSARATPRPGGDADDWDSAPIVCVYVNRPEPGWWGAFMGRVPWIRAAVLAAAVLAALRFLPV